MREHRFNDRFRAQGINMEALSVARGLRP
jgi:hypothetical protein